MGVLAGNEEGGDILMAVSGTTECKKSGLSTLFRLLQKRVRFGRLSSITGIVPGMCSGWRCVSSVVSAARNGL